MCQCTIGEGWKLGVPRLPRNPADACGETAMVNVYAMLLRSADVTFQLLQEDREGLALYRQDRWNVGFGFRESKREKGKRSAQD